MNTSRSTRAITRAVLVGLGVAGLVDVATPLPLGMVLIIGAVAAVLALLIAWGRD